jgi:DNA-binding transcriptional LysR family regulator
MKFTLRQLEVFVAVARSQSVSRAAQELSLSQSAASTALIELERQFDCQLFDRIGKRLQLNALGGQLLPSAVDILDRSREFEASLRGTGGFGALNVGATLTVGNYLATLCIGHFMQLHPESRIHLRVHNTAAVVQQVLRT